MLKLINPLTRHREQFRRLHNLLFKNAAMSYEWLDWYHGKIGNTTRTYGAFDKDSLVGTWSVEPKDFNNGKVIKVGRCFAVGIHPAYRRQGLFVSLSKFAIEQERRLAQYEHILGFPQIGHPVVEGHLKADWEIVQHIETHSIDTVENFTPRSRVQLISDFKAVRSSDNLSGSFKNSPDYRNLRWLEHPDNQYICLAHQNSYIVLKPYGGLCHILDLQGNIGILLEVAKTLCYRHHWQELNIWCAKNEHHRQEIVNAGFREQSSVVSSVVLLAVTINASAPLNLTKSHFQMGVEEGY